MAVPTRRACACSVRAFAIFVLALSTLCLSSCKRPTKSPELDADAVEKTVRAVKTFTTSLDAQSEHRAYPVVVKSGVTTKLSFRVPGKIEELTVQVGQRVAAGDLLARLDTRDYELAVARVEQSLAEAHAGLKAMETGARSEDVSSLEAAYEAAKSQAQTAQKQFDRISSLRSDGTASEMQLDLARTALDGALAAQRAAEKNLEKARKGSREEEIEMVKAKISGLEIDLQLARNKLSDTSLYAPFSGVISERFYDVHESVLPNVAILTLVDDSSFQGDLNVSEDFVARQNAVEQVTCVFEALPGKSFSAQLLETSTTLQTGNRSYLATLRINASPDDGLLIGMVGVATLQWNDRNDLIWIPTAALIPPDSTPTDHDSSNVWIINTDTLQLQRRAVRVGRLENDRVEILEGLREGETIVAAGARFLTDGQTVRLAEEP